jgi:hypothetical protein
VKTGLDLLKSCPILFSYVLVSWLAFPVLSSMDKRDKSIIGFPGHENRHYRATEDAPAWGDHEARLILRLVWSGKSTDHQTVSSDQHTRGMLMQTIRFFTE